MPKDYSGQDLRGRDFSGQDLSGANLTANLSGAILTGLILFGAKNPLTDPGMTRVFRRPGISRADLKEAKGLDTVRGLMP